MAPRTQATDSETIHLNQTFADPFGATHLDRDHDVTTGRLANRMTVDHLRAHGLDPAAAPAPGLRFIWRQPPSSG